MRLALPWLLILTLMILTACIGMEPSKQVSRDREVAGFNKISLMSIGNIYIEQSEFESLRIEADETIIDNIITEVNSDELIINVKTGLFNFPFFKNRNVTPINYYITVKDLNTVDLFGSGSIFIKDLKTDRFSIHLIGSKDMNINLQA